MHQPREAASFWELLWARMELCLSATAQHRRPVLQRGLQLQLQWPTLQPQFLPKALGVKREEAGRSWFKLLVTGRAALPPGRFSTVSALSEQVTLCASTGTRFSSSWRNSSVRHLRKVRGTMMFSSLTNATVKQIVRRQSFFCLCNRGEGLEVWRSQAQVADAVGVRTPAGLRPPSAPRQSCILQCLRNGSARVWKNDCCEICST